MDVEAARSPGRLYAWLWFVGIFAALAYAGRFAGGVEEDAEPLYEWSTVALGLIQFLIVLGVVLLIAIHAPKRELFALRRPTSWWRAARDLGRDLHRDARAQLWRWRRSSTRQVSRGSSPRRGRRPRAGAFATNAFVVIAIAPTIEELTFRGLGFSLLLRFGPRVAIVGHGGWRSRSRTAWSRPRRRSSRSGSGSPISGTG